MEMIATPPPPPPPPPPLGPAPETTTAGAGPEGEARKALPRVYEIWKGNNIFLFGGRLIFGPDGRSLFITISLIVAPVSIFCAFVARKLMDEFHHHQKVLVMAVAIAVALYDVFLLLLTSARDPGIVPRNTHPPEPESYEGSSDVGEGQTPRLRIPRTKDILVNGVATKVKYCDTCMLYRPPRCSHCSICNNCVERFDHHCPWVGQCIGIRNYRFFYMFIFSTTLLCLYVFALCWVYVIKIKNADPNRTIWTSMLRSPASMALIFYTFLTVWFVGGLSIFHLYLIGTNQTTYENFRYRYERRVNPHNMGAFENFKEVFFSSIPPSRNRFRARASLEQLMRSSSASEPFIISPSLSKSATAREAAGRKFPILAGDPELGLRVSDASGEKDAAVEEDVQVVDLSGSQNSLPSTSRPSWGRMGGRLEISPDVVAFSSGVGASSRGHVVGSGSCSNSGSGVRFLSRSWSTGGHGEE